MTRFESGRHGLDVRADRATSWQRIASRTAAEIAAYERLESLRAEAESERLARLAHRPASGRRRGLRLQIGIALTRLAGAIADDSVAGPRPAAAATTTTTPCPD